jgi:hypothetical protein
MIDKAMLKFLIALVFEINAKLAKFLCFSSMILVIAKAQLRVLLSMFSQCF